VAQSLRFQIERPLLSLRGFRPKQSRSTAVRVGTTSLNIEGRSEIASSLDRSSQRQYGLPLWRTGCWKCLEGPGASQGAVKSARTAPKDRAGDADFNDEGASFVWLENKN
jgi:hypothetical protein